MDPISITGIAALDAALTGAGVGAVGGLVTGKSPLKGALLGGAVGGGGSLLGLGGAPIAGSAGGTMDAQMVQDAANAYIKAGYTPEQALGFIDQATKNVGGSAMNTLYGDAGATLQSAAQGPFSASSGGILDYMKSNPSVVLAGGTKLYDVANQQHPLVNAPSGGVSKGKGSSEYQPLLNIEIPKQKYPHSLLLG
jgi:hypothetical protein